MLHSFYANTWRITPWWSRQEHVAVERSVLRLLRVAHHEQLDVAPLLDAHALEHRRFPRYRLRKLAKRLRSGTALIDALEQTPNILSDESILRLRFASQSGTLGDTWDAIIEEASQGTNDIRFQLKQTLLYQGALLVIILFLVSSILAFVAPTFTKLYQEMELPISSGSRLLPEIFGTFATYFWSAMGLLLIASISFLFLKPIRFFRRSVASKWFAPIATLRAAKLLRMLSQSNSAGRPLTGSLSTLARYHYDTTVRGKLLFARNEVEQGVEPWSSLSSSGILTTNETKALKESSTSRIRSWMMLKFANAKEERVLQRAEILVSLIHPLLTLLFGFFVLWLGAICFGGLSQLITSLV